jgi:hypothetical protein
VNDFRVSGNALVVVDVVIPMYATDNYPTHPRIGTWFRDDVRRFVRRLRARFAR